MTTIDSWRHVPGVDNPADLASRGVAVAEICEKDLWWRGPEWLSQPVTPSFTAPAIPDDVEREEKKIVAVHATIVDVDWISRRSSLRALKRIAAYVSKFVLRCHPRRKSSLAGTATPPRVTKLVPLAEMSPSLQTADLDDGFKLLVKITQHQYYPQEFHQLTGRKEVSHNSSLKKLHPFLDRIGIMRISGRLQKCPREEDRKLLIILPGESHLVKLMVLQCHHDHHHAGFQFTWAQLGLQFWIVRRRDRVRHLLRACVVCRRHRAKAAEQLMGQLPTCRVTPSRPFLHTGIDYAGPFPVKSQAGRGWKTTKSWLCLFVCMASKALHLEMVESLSTDAFLATLRRFTSRRGVPAHLYSDNGTNFIGAEKELKEYFNNPDVQSTLSRRLGDDGICWHFLPPSAPHQGGLWEAGVKSAKYHIRRVVGVLTFTKDQFSTLLCEVEAILNSRPLYQRSSEPDDLEPLTPGHLLIGEPLSAIPSPHLLDVPQNRLTQYQLILNRVQDFWRRWSREYLNTLQQRNKWMWEKENVREGDLVLLVEESPPATWKMGRVVTLHPGGDGLVRSVTVKTATNILKRPIIKLIPLLNVD